MAASRGDGSKRRGGDGSKPRDVPVSQKKGKAAPKRQKKEGSNPTREPKETSAPKEVEKSVKETCATDSQPTPSERKNSKKSSKPVEKSVETTPKRVKSVVETKRAVQENDVRVMEWLSFECGGVRAMTSLGDGRLVVARDNGTLDILNDSTHSLLATCRGAEEIRDIRKLHVLEHSPFNSNFVVSTGLHGTVDVWSVDSLGVIASYAAPGPIWDSVIQKVDTESATMTLLCGFDDGTVRVLEIKPFGADALLSFSLDDDEEKKCDAEHPPVITFGKVMANEIHCAITALAVHGDTLFVGTSKASVISFSLKSGHANAKLALPVRKVKAAAPQSQPQPATSASPNVNIFAYLEEQEQAKKKEKRTQVDTIVTCMVADSVLDLLFFGDTRGCVSVIDPKTVTILAEIHSHEAPVSRVTLVPEYVGSSTKTLLSCGVDGRVISYTNISLRGTDSHGLSSENWRVRICRYAHLGDASDVSYTKEGDVCVSGGDGTLAIYKGGLRAVSNVQNLPLRVKQTGMCFRSPHTCARFHDLMLETTSDAVRVWGLDEDSISAAEVKSIIDAAAATLTLPETKAIAAKLKQQQLPPSQWLANMQTSCPVKLAEIKFAKKTETVDKDTETDTDAGDAEAEAERVRDATIIDRYGDNKVDIYVVTTKKVHAFSLDIEALKIVPKELPRDLRRDQCEYLAISRCVHREAQPRAEAESKGKKKTSKKGDVTETVEEPTGDIVVSYRRKEESEFSLGCFAGESLTWHIAHLPCAAVYSEIFESGNLLVKMADGSLRVYSGNNFEDCVIVPMTSKLTHTNFAYVPSKRWLVEASVEGNLAIFSIAERQLLSLKSAGSASDVLSLKLKNLWEEKTVSVRSLLASDADAEGVKVTLVTKRNIATLTCRTREGDNAVFVDTPVTGRRLATQLATDDTAVTTQMIESKKRLYVQTVSADTLDQVGPMPYMRKQYKAQ